MAHSHTPRNSCVRFVFGIATASRNTRLQAARYGLTWTGLAPADRASLLAPSLIRSPRRRGRAASAARSRPSALAVLRLMTSSNLVGCMHRQVGRLLALEDSAGIDADLATRVRSGALSIAHQPAGGDPSRARHRSQEEHGAPLATASCTRRLLNSVSVVTRSASARCLDQRGEGRIDVACCWQRLGLQDLPPDRASGRLQCL